MVGWAVELQCIATSIGEAWRCLGNGCHDDGRRVLRGWYSVCVTVCCDLTPLSRSSRARRTCAVPASRLHPVVLRSSPRVLKGANRLSSDDARCAETSSISLPTDTIYRVTNMNMALCCHSIAAGKSKNADARSSRKNPKLLLKRQFPMRQTPVIFCGQLLSTHYGTTKNVYRISYVTN